MTAAAIAPSTTPPATTESNVFFKDGVTEASANKGEVIDVITAADIAALAFDLTFSTLRIRCHVISTELNLMDILLEVEYGFVG